MSGITTAFNPLPRHTFPVLWPWGFYLQSPSYPFSPPFFFFFNILILLWGRELSNEQDHF
jgi:hypothetical protein